MTLLWHQRFDVLEKILETEKKNIVKSDTERKNHDCREQ